MTTNDLPTFNAIDSRGRSRVLKAEAIEVRWPDGRTLTLSLPFADEGDIELQAEAPAGVPVITL
jgi:probable rRNA maturation factor